MKTQDFRGLFSAYYTIQILHLFSGSENTFFPIDLLCFTSFFILYRRIYIYIFGRYFYPKGFTLYCIWYIYIWTFTFYQFLLSLGIEEYTRILYRHLTLIQIRLNKGNVIKHTATIEDFSWTPKQMLNLNNFSDISCIGGIQLVFFCHYL